MRPCQSLSPLPFNAVSVPSSSSSTTGQRPPLYPPLFVAETYGPTLATAPLQEHEQTHLLQKTIQHCQTFAELQGANPSNKESANCTPISLHPYLPELVAPAVQCSECAIIVQQHNNAMLAPQVAVRAVSTRHWQEHRGSKLRKAAQVCRQMQEHMSTDARL
jgi:hypothetical protein